MPIPQTPENLVLQAVMDEYEENREKGNLTAEILNKERVSVGTFKSYTCIIILNSYKNSMCLIVLFFH